MKLKKNKIFLGVGLVTFILLTLFIVNKPNAKSLNTNIDESKTINKDNNSIAMYIIDGEQETKIDQIPEGNYVLNDKSYCKTKDSNNDETITIDYVDKKINISNITKKGTKCYLYFEKQPLIKDKLVPNGQTLGTLTTLSGTTCDTGCDDDKSGIYTATDYDNNPSYVWRGTVDNNLVHFANKYWRIIRVNGDGSLRLIYDGTTKHNNGESNTDRQIGKIAYNKNSGDNMYVGFRFESGKKQGSKYPSTILGADSNPAVNTLNKWYEDNIKGKPAENRIDKNAIFCNDRRSSTTATTFANRNNQGGTGTNTTYYGAYLRILPNGSWGAQQTADLSCESADQFSAKGATKGNGTLVYPIGLITADEVLLAGGFGNKANQRYYLYTGQDYWTMSPYYFNGSSASAYVFRVYSDGDLYYYNVSSATGVRPVINLKADTTFSSGNGSYDEPYEVS